MLALIPVLLGGWLKSVMAILSGLPREVWYVIAGGLLFLFGWHLVYLHDKAVWNGGYNAGWSVEHRALLNEQQSHAVTRASLNMALNRIAAQNDAIDQLAAESVKRIAASDAARKAAVSAAQRGEDHARALDASSAVVGPRDAPCVPSKAFLDLSGEL